MLQANYQRANELLLEQFDEHMKQVLPKPELLPVRLDIVLRKDGQPDVTIDNIIQVKPF